MILVCGFDPVEAIWPGFLVLTINYLKFILKIIKNKLKKFWKIISGDITFAYRNAAGHTITTKI